MRRATPRRFAALARGPHPGGRRAGTGFSPVTLFVERGWASKAADARPILHRNMFSPILVAAPGAFRRQSKAMSMTNDAEAGAGEAPSNGPITIKKYANRRLYNTATSCYVTLDYLSQLVKSGGEFVVYDAKTGEDITRSVLTHIIVEEEAKGQNMLPVSFLRHVISFYGDSLQVVVPRYLEHAMQAFARNQEQIRDYLRGAFDGLMPFSFEEMSKQQLALFERTLRMFTPFYGDVIGEAIGREKETRAIPEAKKTKCDSHEAQIADLREQLQTIQQRLDAMTQPPAKRR